MSKKNMESTRELMETKEVTNYSVRTYRNDELVYFLIQPSNISVLSQESLSARIYGLMTVLKGITEIEMMCLNSRGHTGRGEKDYQQRSQQEPHEAGKHGKLAGNGYRSKQLTGRDYHYCHYAQKQGTTAPYGCVYRIVCPRLG